MSLLSAADLLRAGWDESQITSLLAEVRRLEEKGVSDATYALRRLRRFAPPPDRSLRMRAEPAPLAEAIEARSKMETKNLAIVRRCMRELLLCPVIEAGAIMPDACPAGGGEASIPVGGVVAARKAILPGAHGADICCSLHATFFADHARPTASMLDALMASTRFGPGGRPTEDWVPHPVLDEPVWTNPFLRGLERYARMHMADQGDGNHFAFLGRVAVDEQFLGALRTSGRDDLANKMAIGRTYFTLVTHHGSRGLGAHVFKRALEVAVRATAKIAQGIPDNAAWLAADSPDGQAYWEALGYIARWTRANHEAIHQRFLSKIEAVAIGSLGNEHNFVWRRGDFYLHGKGATPAWVGEDGRPLLGLVPMNMASPILLVLGSDSQAHLSFCPHGAGRNVSRRRLLEDFRGRDGLWDEKLADKALRESTAGVEVRWFSGRPDVTEAPLAYKSAAEVQRQIEAFGLATVVARIHPLGCIMAGRGEVREDELTPKQKRQIEHRSDRRRDRIALRHGEWPEANTET